MIDKNFWQNKRILITGHTGFKGSWLCLWLHALGANISGYSLSPPTSPCLFDQANIKSIVTSVIADIRDLNTLTKTIQSFQPEIIVHMAAQSLVRNSYANPVDTYSTNIMGTVNLLEAIRSTPDVKVLLNITSDKCYENKEWPWGYRENDRLGGFDPYSNSKACSELVTSAYRDSFFNPKNYAHHGVALATARAGNVVGGGDWASDRLIPDCIRAIENDKKIILRNPNAIRPWQHVLEALSGYLLLIEKLHTKGLEYSGAWNFGPSRDQEKSVEWIAKELCQHFEHTAGYEIDPNAPLHESQHLTLDCTKSKTLLGCKSRWDLAETIDKVCNWTKDFWEKKNIQKSCLRQIAEYSNAIQ